MSDTKKTTANAKSESKVATATSAVANTSSAVREAATAYASGVSAISKAVFGIGREVVGETVEHGKASMSANCVRSLAEMQAGYVQRRIESSTVHVKTVADVATESFKDVYAPLIGLLKNRKAA
jgi:hypothetical protein